MKTAIIDTVTAPRTDAECKALFDRYLAEMEQMSREIEENQRETAKLRTQTQATLSNIEQVLKAF
jgi:hypothetical protein